MILFEENQQPVAPSESDESLRHETELSLFRRVANSCWKGERAIYHRSHESRVVDCL